ncbi:TetR family transcriptional regulator [Actinorhabdospora filicis]|uniref:TetR family transcriptional regulator n=1 Tax=Actinorhabdospora filicis TaxID=1785913 RepID=A0A9W6SPD1_9ACTN|nr:TetR/AcrR family transcriptional regulator [Actinorhabdospora filicis]GLZ80549.1 TetR family transcriptional regulator [Actinorhabdospora filicis]
MPAPERRSERAHSAILDAVFDLCVERGYAKVTIEAIAARAAVGKPTIYRWWPSKGALALEALHVRIGHATDFPDTGDVAADLRAQMASVSRLFAGDIGIIYRGVIAEAQGDPDLVEAVRATIIGPRAKQCGDRLAIAVERGELRPDVPLRTMCDLLYASLYQRMLLGAGEAHLLRVPEVVDLILDGLRPRT